MTPIHWKRAAGLGFLSWLMPFLFAFLVFPLKQLNAALFETVMSLTLIVTAAVLARRYFRDVTPHLGEALVIGLLWVTINLIMDYPMFAYGPMKMSASTYYSAFGGARLARP